MNSATGPSSSKRRCTFNKNLKKIYPFLQTTSDETLSSVYCNFCRCTFSLAHGGQGDIKQHILTSKHKTAAAACVGNKYKHLTNFYTSVVFDAQSKKVAAAEAAWVYHLIKHNHSFRSADCTSKMIQSIFDSKYSLARTKSEAIITNVLAPVALET